MDKKMDESINVALSNAWDKIANLKNLKTPDNSVGRSYTINSVTSTTVEIKTNGNSTLTIQRTAFIETLRYLVDNQHTITNPCKIGSNQKEDKAGPLCRAARAVNSGMRVINYTVPILTALEILGMNGKRPNTTWLVKNLFIDSK
jgi:hypothetical protein